MRRALITIVVLGALLLPGTAEATGVTNFDPRPASLPEYDMPERPIQHELTSFDGTTILVETFVPTKDGGPLDDIPTILEASPYASRGQLDPMEEVITSQLVSHGYAFSRMHLRGTGSSGGCTDYFGPTDVRDISLVLRYLGQGENAPGAGPKAHWSNGDVGLWGMSYSSATAIAASSSAEPDARQHVKAQVIGGSASSLYDVMSFDGVPSYVNEPAYLSYLYRLQGFTPDPTIADKSDYYLTEPGRDPSRYSPEYWGERSTCLADMTPVLSDPSSSVNSYYQAREYRDDASNVEAATLMYHGMTDTASHSNAVTGFFNRLPEDTPKAGVFGDFGHLRLFVAREDGWDMILAWYDQFLQGSDTGADEWPVAQVGGTDGLWREEPDWPTTGGPVGWLPLGVDGSGNGTLGQEPGATPSSSYTESVSPIDEDFRAREPGSFVAFRSPELPERLEITGQPVLDLWLKLDRPDAHIAVEIATFDENGEPIGKPTNPEEPLTIRGTVQGFRSMQHLDPYVDNVFVQAEAKSPSVGDWFRTTVRFNPTDLVIPKGGYLTLTIAGSQIWERAIPATEHPTRPSYMSPTITIAHGCDMLSALRFVMPREQRDVVRVRQAETPPTAQPSIPHVISDGGGLATSTVCGEGPTRDGFTDILGEEI